MKAGPRGFLFAFAFNRNDDLVINHNYIENNWLAADLAVFDVVLVGYGSVQQDIYGLSAIGALHGFFI
jgi:hypothetical protein